MWELTDRSAAKLRESAFSWEVDPQHPQRGGKLLAGTTSSPLPVETLSLFRVTAAGQKPYAWKLHESFVRGADLVASYAPWPGDAVEPHFYWRHRTAHEGKLSGVEVIVSVHTSLLDSRPAIAVSGDVPCSGIEDVELPAGMFLMTPEGSKRKVLLWVHPSDFTEMEIHPGKTPDTVGEWTTTLFSESFLEKGVIRRARLGFWSVPAEVETSELVRLYEQLTEEAPPLTT